MDERNYEHYQQKKSFYQSLTMNLNILEAAP